MKPRTIIEIRPDESGDGFQLTCPDGTILWEPHRQAAHYRACSWVRENTDTEIGEFFAIDWFDDEATETEDAE